MIHIGKEIKKEMKAQGRSNQWLGEQLHLDRIGVYYMYNRQSIDTLQLSRICRLLGKDFFIMLSEDLDNPLPKPGPKPGAKLKKIISESTISKIHKEDD